MRKLAILGMAMFGLAIVTQSQAQPANSAPQPGLPPGAAIGAPNAQQPRSSGVLTTTTTGAQPAPMASAPYESATTAPPRVRRSVHHRRRARHARHMRMAPVAAPAQ